MAVAVLKLPESLQLVLAYLQGLLHLVNIIIIIIMVMMVMVMVIYHSPLDNLVTLGCREASLVSKKMMMMMMDESHSIMVIMV